LAELADEDGEGLLQDQVLLQELTMLEYTKTQAVEKMGEIPVSSQAELKSIALEEVEEIQSNAFSWIDPTQQ
jgi:Ni,Fe-hydrogenase III large subunit